MKRVYIFFVLVVVLIGCKKSDPSLADQIENSLRKETLDKWYPLAIDSTYGGFLSSFTYDFKTTDDQKKMIVTQARHTWTNSKASLRYPDAKHFKRGAKHGYDFLRKVMWD